MAALIDLDGTLLRLIGAQETTTARPATVAMTGRTSAWQQRELAGWCRARGRGGAVKDGGDLVSVAHDLHQPESSVAAGARTGVWVVGPEAPPRAPAVAPSGTVRGYGDPARVRALRALRPRDAVVSAPDGNFTSFFPPRRRPSNRSSCACDKPPLMATSRGSTAISRRTFSWTPSGRNSASSRSAGRVFSKTEVRTLSPGVEALVGVYLDHLGSSAKTGCDLGKTLFRTNFAASPREANRALWGYGELPPDMQSEGCGLMSPATAQEIAPIIRHALASEDLEPELRDALPALAELCERCQPDEFVVISYG